MKKILLFLGIAAIALATGCKKDNNGPGHDGQPPLLLLDGKDIYEDTMKVASGAELLLPFTIVDDQTSHELSMSKLQGGIVYYEDLVLNNASVKLESVSSGLLRFLALEAGAHSFFLNLEDGQGESSTALVKIIALDNLKPVPLITVEQLDEVAPYHVRFDASKSFDQDGPWGGEIIAYRFHLEGFYTVETERPVLDYIYPAPGTYAAELQVQDNDEVWSEKVRLQVVVE